MARGRWAILLLCAALAGLVGVLPEGAAAASKAAADIAKPGTNLLVNPAAEVGECTTSGYDAMTVPGWTVTSGSPDSVCYGSAGFPAHGPSGAGHAFFAGGATGDAVMSQRVDLTPAFNDILDGGVSFRMAAWLGGWAGQDDRVGVRLEFDDAGGDSLGTSAIAPVTNTDRGLSTGFTLRTATGIVPLGTRTVLITLSFTWTEGDTTDGYADDLSFTLTAPATKPVLHVPDGGVVPTFDHVFFVFMANENYAASESPARQGDYVVRNPAAAYLNRTVASGGSLLSQMHATTHPGDPNALAITGGSTFGWTSDLVAGENRVAARHLGDELDASGKSWAAYADGMAYPCDTSVHDNAAGGWYRPDAEPFILYQDVVGNPLRCAQHVKPLDALARDLASPANTPDFVWFAANNRDDMHGGVAAGDNWLANTLPVIMHSPAWTRQRSLLIISWDQGYETAYGPDYSNHVATYVLGSQGLVKDGYISRLRYTDYSLAATIEAALGIGPLTSNDRYAGPLTDVWTTSGQSGGIPPGAQA